MQAQPQPWRLFLLCAVVQLAITVILGPVVGRDLFTLQTSLDPAVFRGIVRRWSAAELNRFRMHFVLDAGYPMLYGTLLHRRARAMLPWSGQAACMLLSTLGLAAALLDVVENAFHWSTLPDPTAAPGWVIRAAAVAGIGKWCLLVPAIAALAPGGAAGHINTLRARKAGLRRKKE